VTPDYFGVLQSLSFLAFAYMGGISSVTGAVIAGFLVTNGLVFTALQNWVGISPDYTILIGGLGLIATIVLNPDGIAGTWRVIGARYRDRTSRDGGAAPPEGGLLVPEPPPQSGRPDVPAVVRSTSTETN